MKKLSKADILHVAKLAKLNLTDDEIEKFSTQLSNIVSHFEELSSVNTQGVEPSSQTTGLENVYRTDEAKSTQSLSQDEALAGSDKIFNGYFKVGAILTERTDK